MDMIGRVDPDRLLADSLNYIHVVGENRVSSEIKPIVNSLNDSKGKLISFIIINYKVLIINSLYYLII
jgi:hypothetical protein